MEADEAIVSDLGCDDATDRLERNRFRRFLVASVPTAPGEVAGPGGGPGGQKQAVDRHPLANGAAIWLDQVES